MGEHTHRACEFCDKKITFSASVTEPTDLPLLGCLHECTILSAAADHLIVDGPAFTADKINKNGWGISSHLAPAFAASLKGSPIRYCPHGTPLPGLHAQHMCDALNDTKSIAGEVQDVYASGTDEKGRPVYRQRAVITAAHVIQGLLSGVIPPKWSVYGRGKKHDATGMFTDAVGTAVSLVDEPAYSEAVFQLAASVGSNLPLYKLGDKSPGNEPFGDHSMGNEVPNNIQTPAPPAQASPAPAVAPGTQPAAGPAAQPTAPTIDAVTKEKLDKIDLLIKENEELKKQIKDATKSPAAEEDEVMTEAQIKKLISDARVQERDQLTRETLAKEIVQYKVAAGLLKPEDMAKAEERLVPLAAAELESQKADYSAIAKKLRKTGDKPLSAAFFPVPDQQTIDPRALAAYEKMGVTPADVEKYAKIPQRSLTALGGVTK
jgi:hypothetical protein